MIFISSGIGLSEEGEEEGVPSGVGKIEISLKGGGIVENGWGIRGWRSG